MGNSGYNPYGPWSSRYVFGRTSMAMEARMARRGMMEIQQLSKGDGFLRYGYTVCQ